MGTKEDLGFYWIARFADNNVIEQFDVNGDEVRFQEVLDYPEALKEFKIMSSEQDDEYTVDFDTQRINTPTRNYQVAGNNPELIYFRRNDVRMEIGPAENRVILPPLVVHHIGLKTDTNEKKFEVFKGLGQNPRKIEMVDVKANSREDITN